MADTANAQLQVKIAKARSDRAAAEAAENERLDKEWRARGTASLRAELEAEEASLATYRKSVAAPAPAPTQTTRSRPSNDEE